jgi:hypothetical protein
MRKAGGPESVIMAITRHSTRQMFDRYNTVDSEDLKAAVDRLSGHFANVDHSVDQDAKNEEAGTVRRFFDGDLEGQPSANADFTAIKKLKAQPVSARPVILAFLLWCRRPDLNRHGCYPLPPQDSVSTKFHHFGTSLLTFIGRKLRYRPPCRHG